MRAYRLSIVRHGRTNANREARYIGVTDDPLSQEGKKELQDKWEENDYPKVQRVYASPLQRAYQSAEILFPDREIVLVEELREMDFGEFENKTAVELVERDDYQTWLQGGEEVCPPGGESLKSVVERSYNGLRMILANMMEEKLTHCGVVTHSGILMNLLSCFGLPKLSPMEFACSPGEGYEIVITPQYWMNSGVFEIMGKVPYTVDFDQGYDF